MTSDEWALDRIGEPAYIVRQFELLRLYKFRRAP